MGNKIDLLNLLNQVKYCFTLFIKFYYS